MFLPNDLIRVAMNYSLTVCPGSSDPSEKIFIYICIRKLGLHWYLTITIFKVEYYSFTEQNNFRSHELDCIK